MCKILVPKKPLATWSEEDSDLYRYMFYNTFSLLRFVFYFGELTYNSVFTLQFMTNKSLVIFQLLHQLGIAMFRTVYLLCIWFLFQVVFLKKYWFCSPALDGSSQFAIMQTRKRRLKVVADSAEKGNLITQQFRLKILNICTPALLIGHHSITSFFWIIIYALYIRHEIYTAAVGQIHYHSLGPDPSVGKENMDTNQGCALRKIEGSPVLWACKIQGAQHMICMKKLWFSSRPRTKVRCQGSAWAHPYGGE